MVRNNITLRVLGVGIGSMHDIPKILISMKAREESGFREGEIIKVMRSGCTAYAYVGKQLKEYANEHYGCVMNAKLNLLVPSLPEDEVHLEEVREEVYEMLNKFPMDELEQVKRLVSPQEIAMASVYGLKGKRLHEAVSLQCMSQMFTQKVEQAIRGIPEFRLRSGRIMEKVAGQKIGSKILCELRHGEKKFHVCYVPYNEGKKRSNKFEIQDKVRYKKFYFKTLNKALDKLLKIASKVMEE